MLAQDKEEAMALVKPTVGTQKENASQTAMGATALSCLAVVMAQVVLA